MIFSFLKYIHPIDYFNLKKQDGTTVFPDPDQLPEIVRSKLTLDTGYQTSLAQKRDLAWQAIQKGFIGDAETLSWDENLALVDEYRFVRKYFHRLWPYYILFIRTLTFHNPIKEFLAFYRSRKTPRVNIYQHPIVYDDWDRFEGDLVRQAPKVSVIIPTLNRYSYLKDVLHDLEAQDYANFDVIVIDQSDPFQRTFYDDFALNIQVIYQAEREICLARDTAILASDSEYLLLFDDDSRVKSDWLRNHLKCLDYFKAEISAGTSISVIGARVPEAYRHLKLSNQIDTGNVMLKREVFHHIGLFDRQLEKIGLEDAELGLRAYLAGFLNVSNPFSQRLHLKAGTGGFREIGIWDGLRSAKWFAPRPTPSFLYIGRKYYGSAPSIYSLLTTVPPSLIPIQYKRNKKLLFLGYFLFLFAFPVVFFQVIASWYIAGKKIKEGPKIKSISVASLNKFNAERAVR